MSTAFDFAFRRVKELVAIFKASAKFYLSQAYQEQEARRDFQKRSIRCKLRLKINGRCLFKTRKVASHGSHSVEGQQGHRIKIGLNPSRARNQRLAQASPAAGKTRFYFPQTPARRVCGRLLLAWLPVALSDAARQPALLAKQDFTKHGEGSRHNSALETHRLASASTLATFAEGFRFCRSQNQIRIEHWKPMTQNWRAQL